ncbi:E3 ubiquitin-protein ligase RNF14-like [Glandiceps talaboti]
MAVGGVVPDTDFPGGENFQDQHDELTVLQSIFEDKIIVLSEANAERPGSVHAFQIRIPVNLPCDKVAIEAWLPIEADMAQTETLCVNTSSGRPNLCRSDSGKRWHSTFTLAQLTPLEMNISFPISYPGSAPPIFTLGCHWLEGNQLSALCRHLDAMWGEMPQLPIVFTWVDWLQNETLSFLGLEKTVVMTPHIEQDTELLGTIDPRALPMSCDLHQAIVQVLRYNLMYEMEQFQKENHDCGVCFDNRPGREFYRLNNCLHHFCHDCLASYCQTHVTDGTIQLLLCPDIDCKNPLPPALVKDVLNDEHYQRYERLMLQKTLDGMEDIDYCPRCNMVVIKELDSSKLAHCTSCFYSYCTECKEAWHQGTKCATLDDKLEELEKEKEQSEEAKRIAERLRQFIESEKLTKKTIKETSVPCPGCHVRIEKSMGCNYMTCSRCRVHFCWLCQRQINGYDHFGDSCQTFDINGDYMAPRPQPIRQRELAQGAQDVAEVLTLHPEKKKYLKQCPTCHQKNLKQNNNNHLKCWCCNSNFCFLCGQRIVGKVTSHFTTQSACKQHTE